MLKKYWVRKLLQIIISRKESPLHIVLLCPCRVASLFLQNLFLESVDVLRTGLWTGTPTLLNIEVTELMTSSPSYIFPPKPLWFQKRFYGFASELRKQMLSKAQECFPCLCSEAVRSHWADPSDNLPAGLLYWWPCLCPGGWPSLQTHVWRWVLPFL